MAVEERLQGRINCPACPRIWQGFWLDKPNNCPSCNYEWTFMNMVYLPTSRERVVPMKKRGRKATKKYYRGRR